MNVCLFLAQKKDIGSIFILLEKFVTFVEEQGERFLLSWYVGCKCNKRTKVIVCCMATTGWAGSQQPDYEVTEPVVYEV